MSQNISNDSNSAEINVVLTNFQGLQYDANEDTEYEVIASYVNSILSNDRIRINHKSHKPEIIIKIPIDTADDDEISNLFLNTLLLTLTKHEDGMNEAIGYCNIDLSSLCSIKCESFKSHKQINSEKITRKISFDVKAFTDVPLLKTNYENCLYFVLESICGHYFENDMNREILIAINAPFKASKTALFKLSSCELQKGVNLNAVFKSVILTSEASLSLHDDIRAFKNVSIELLINSNEHLFGSINCEELLYVGRTTIRNVVPLYRFDNDVFIGCFQRNSIFYTPKSQSLAKNKRISRKKDDIHHESDKLLEDIKALNNEGNQITAVVRMELEKPLNTEIPYEVCMHSYTKGYDKLSSKNILISDMKNELLCSGFSLETEFSITSKITVLLDQTCFNDETFSCNITSEINNSKNQCSEQHKFILTDVYKSLDMIDKSEDIFLHDIHKNDTAWLDYAIFNAKQEEFDKVSIAVDEQLNINPQSLISNILKAYLLFKSQKYPASLNLLSHLKAIYGEIEELCIMQYVINAMLGLENDPVNNNSIKHEEIESIYNRTELLWFASTDDCFISWQNLFIKSAIFFIKIGCYEIAELCLGEYYQKYGINVNYLYLLAAIDTSKGNFKEALYHLNRISENDVVNHNVNYCKIVKSIILNLLHTRNFKKAAELFNTYIQTQSCDNFLILYLLGSHFNRTNEFVIAKEFLIQAVKLFHCHLVFLELGNCFVGLNLLELAEKAFLNALQFETNDIDSLVSLKETYKIQGRYDAINFCDYNIQYNNNINNNVH
ncbi:unnamed protein product [Chironomus riparius]|uniref:Uncharacterized protein n=1 Tax=Chironomus riparius TaxID=315576 RepID=A0A9N9RI83_9DIPT|nr:unnamed protein product [Chironomus riparius]